MVLGNGDGAFVETANLALRVPGEGVIPFLVGLRSAFLGMSATQRLTRIELRGFVTSNQPLKSTLYA